MSQVEAALYKIVTTNAAATAVIGTRLYPLVIPYGVTLPAVAYQRISTSRAAAHTTVSSRGLAEGLYQFSCVGTSYATAKSASSVVRGALDQYSGTVSGVAGVTIDRVHCQNEIDLYNELPDTRQSRYTATVDFTVWYVE